MPANLGKVSVIPQYSVNKILWCLRVLTGLRLQSSKMKKKKKKTQVDFATPSVSVGNLIEDTRQLSPEIPRSSDGWKLGAC